MGQALGASARTVLLNVLAQQFPREQLDRELAVAGFKVLAAYDFLPEQFFVVYGAR